jgi:hypothetical protein
MIRMRERRLARYVAVMLLLNMYIVPACLAAGASKAVPVRTCLVFPFEVTGSGVPESLAADLQSKIQTGLSMSGGFRAISFSENMPSVQRAVLETAIKKDELKGPFGIEKEQVDVAVKIGRETGVDCVLVGVVEASADAANHTGSVTITAEMVDVKTGQQNTVGVSGVSSSDSGAGVVVLISQAASDAASKLVTSLTPPGAIPVKTNGGTAEKKSKSKWLWILLLAGAAAALSGGSSSSGGDDNPPPPP